MSSCGVALVRILNSRGLLLVAYDDVDAIVSFDTRPPRFRLAFSKRKIRYIR